MFYLSTHWVKWPESRLVVCSCLLLIFCKQFGPKSGPTKRQALSGSKPFEILELFLKKNNTHLLKGLILKESADGKNMRNFPACINQLKKCRLMSSAAIFHTNNKLMFVCLVWLLTPQSTAMVMSGRSFHLTTIFFQGKFTSTSCTYFRL